MATEEPGEKHREVPHTSRDVDVLLKSVKREKAEQAALSWCHNVLYQTPQGEVQGSSVPGAQLMGLQGSGARLPQTIACPRLTEATLDGAAPEVPTLSRTALRPCDATRGDEHVSRIRTNS